MIEFFVLYWISLKMVQTCFLGQTGASAPCQTLSYSPGKFPFLPDCTDLQEKVSQHSCVLCQVSPQKVICSILGLEMEGSCIFSFKQQGELIRFLFSAATARYAPSQKTILHCIYLTAPRRNPSKGKIKTKKKSLKDESSPNQFYMKGLI